MRIRVHNSGVKPDYIHVELEVKGWLWGHWFEGWTYFKDISQWRGPTKLNWGRRRKLNKERRRLQNETHSINPGLHLSTGPD